MHREIYVISHNNSHRFTERVNKYLAWGWKLHGEPKIGHATYDDGSTSMEYAQVLLWESDSGERPPHENQS